MDLTDILFSKPFIGNSGGGGGGSNVETANIEITITDSTPEITSGAFPDWCTKENTQYIYGRARWTNIGSQGTQLKFGTVFWTVESSDEFVGLEFIQFGAMYGVATDLSLIAGGTEGPTPLTGDWIINITLIYMPEDTGGDNTHLD